MTEDQAKIWMIDLAVKSNAGQLPSFDRVWAIRQLEQEFERRRKAAAPLAWWDFAIQSAAGFTVAALLVC